MQHSGAPRPGDRAYHLKREAEEAARAAESTDLTVQSAHQRLAKLHGDRARSDEAPQLLVVRE